MGGARGAGWMGDDVGAGQGGWLPAGADPPPDPLSPYADLARRSPAPYATPNRSRSRSPYDPTPNRRD
eukprot:gene22050-26959_t